MNGRRVAMFLGACALLGGLPAFVAAQQMSQSVADAARKTKEQQKQATKAKVVWTNDNIPTSATVSVVGQAPQGGTAATAGQPPTPTAEAAAESPEQLATDRDNATADLAQAQKDLASAKSDLDIAQREEKLDSDQFYGTPDYAGDRQGQAKLAADKTQAAAKQQAVDAVQKKVDELQKHLDDLNNKLKGTAPAPKQ